MMEHWLSGSLQGLRATLIGLGTRTHVALARYLVRQGARVRISERKPREQLAAEITMIQDLPIDLRTGGHRDEDVADADVVFVSPGVPRDLPILALAQARGIPLSSEIELLFARCRAPIVGITGSAGKTTTTTLVGKIFEADGRRVHVGGNIGVPLIEQVDEITLDELVVLELSSFQLEALHARARVGAILNVTPNHLDRHPTFEHYRESKFNLLREQTPDDVAVLGADDPVAASLAPRCPGAVRWFSARQPVEIGAFRQSDLLLVRDARGDRAFAEIADLKLPGAHNVLNVLAAAAIASAIGATPGAIGEVARSFAGVEHRLEHVRDLRGVAYVNDSIATAPERTIAALRAINRPIVLIAGGRSKHLPMVELARLIVEKARSLVVIGEMADEIVDAVRAVSGGESLPIDRAASLALAVQRAHERAQPGDVVLLSPAGTSYDQFRDFEERGRVFKEAVWDLAPEAK